MPKVRTQAAKRSLLRNVRRQRLNYITVLPSLITIINGLSGFTAIVLASKGSAHVLGQFTAFALAGYMVLIAMIADILDGRVARISRNTSSFGGQLDSLCDIISFGVAPAFITLKVLEHYLLGTGLNPVLETYLQRFFWLASAAYVSCAAIRLARFNVENEEDESAHMSFIGLPSPAAAGVLVSLVIFHQETIPELADKGTAFYKILDYVIIYTLPFIIIGTALLMVSRIRYSHVLNQYFKGKKPFAYLLSCLLILSLIIWVRQPALVVGFCGFAISGFARWVFRRLKQSTSSANEAIEENPQLASNPDDKNA
ncbi:MAG: phosphatidylcholine/phosphatidylserine synthase [Sedimentisphaerales bacterium]|nr:phosphatidylcholine/phosphatidylserine synthase [Sedimentisphaerales bacterium]